LIYLYPFQPGGATLWSFYKFLIQYEGLYWLD
jgi:hypothetical protein